MEIVLFALLFLIGGISSAYQAMKWLERRQLGKPKPQSPSPRKTP
jgi:glycerol-3-phosphate acyltransferase PlsY